MKEHERKNVIVINMTDDHSDYCYGVIDCETGKPLEFINLCCCGDNIETDYLFYMIRSLNLYSNFCEQPCDLINKTFPFNHVAGKRPVDIKDGCWFGGIISEIVLAGLKSNRNYNILHSYGMTEHDGWYEYTKSMED